ncbi:MAG: hypothetical protein M3178_16640 [Pseudomonadota bacterium]|nr:hypothetical protein [Pseudomonadota bacterium]
MLIRGGGRIIIDCRRRIYWNRSIVEENMARGDRHGNREAKKKPKKLKPKEIGPTSTLASIQKKALEGIVALAKNRRFLSRFGSAVSALKH